MTPLARNLLTVALLTALGACQTQPFIVLPPEALAASAPRLAVVGRVGWLPQRELRFGEYRTTALRGGGVRTRTQACAPQCAGTEIGFYKHKLDQAFSTSTSRLSYTLLGPDGQQAQVQAVGQLHQQHKASMTQWFGLPTDVVDETLRSLSFAGTIEPARDDQPGWRFVVWDGSGAPGPRQILGWAESERGQRLNLTPLYRWQGQDQTNRWHMPGRPLGYAFELDGVAVAAVDTVAAGAVWLRADLPPDLRLGLASLASVLLLRADLDRVPPPGSKR